MYQSSSLGSRGGKHTSSQVPGAKRCKEREASPARGGWGIVDKAWIWATRERAGWGWTGSAEAETRLVSGLCGARTTCGTSTASPGRRASPGGLGTCPADERSTGRQHTHLRLPVRWCTGAPGGDCRVTGSVWTPPDARHRSLRRLQLPPAESPCFPTSSVTAVPPD